MRAGDCLSDEIAIRCGLAGGSSDFATNRFSVTSPISVWPLARVFNLHRRISLKSASKSAS